ncbi:hypothetical protein EJ08DRAFT_93341 [Tothia fuscella]|uniref:LPXTG-motif cell wall anchor domain protein n=1 Tax=Tothia fuscella TaxID=1048955 RepID=A0A9P4U1Q9_9PEZI|nr:hypothetical protein EJ08DRAFT_93341 [Tothia fuscella]
MHLAHDNDNALLAVSKHKSRKHNPKPKEKKEKEKHNYHRLFVPSVSDLESHRPRTAPSPQTGSTSTSPAKAPTSLDFIPRIKIFNSLRTRANKNRDRTPILGDLTGNNYSKHQLSSTSLSSSSRSVSSPYALESHSEIKLPSSRRPPASWSSGGIETSFGPPPALITRGSYNSDLARRAQSPAATTLAQQKHKPYTISVPAKDLHIVFKQDSFINTPSQQHDQSLEADSSPLSPNLEASSYSLSINAMMDAPSARSATSGFQEGGVSTYTDRPSSVHDSLPGGDTEDSGQSAEDIFLNIAEDNPVESRQYETQSRLERKSSRGRRPNQRQSLPVTSDIPPRPRRDSSSHDSGYATRSVVQTSDGPVKEQRRASSTSMGFRSVPSRNPASLSTDQRFNAYRNRYMASTPQSSRKQSTADASRSSTYRPSRLNNNLDSASTTGSPLEHRQSSGADGAESVVSNAQSTVWDELHELKSRIHKMELNDIGGTMSNGSAERPRTATTTVTTMSSSPKYPFKSGLSPTESVIGGPGAANIHPLLHQSLARCKQLLNPALHRTLELAAADALEMVVLASNGSQGNMYSSASIVNGMMVDRQLRRKADNVCRNLTDLCIALCEGKLELPSTPAPATASASRRGSRDIAPSSLASNDTINRMYSRQASLEPESIEHTRSAPSRALDRIEARRASLMSFRHDSPQANDSQAVTSTEHTPSPQVLAKTPRTGTSLLRTRRRAVAQVTDDDDDGDDPAKRPLSRAATEIGSGGARRRSHRLSGGGFLGSKVADREYTSQHPLPGSSPLSAPVSRRFNGSALKAESPRSPLTSSSLLRGERRVDNSLRAADSDSGAVDEERRLQRRSFGVYGSGGRASLGLGKRDSVRVRSNAAAGNGSGGGGAES